MKWQGELDLAVRAAADAALYLEESFGQEKVVLEETGRDIKLQADRDAEDRILTILSQSEYPVLAEESGEHGILEDRSPFWIVDPLDGTMNYKHGIPLCCVSIALCQGNEPILGVIDDFNRVECLRGVVGEGAWMGDTPIRVSSTTRADRAILATGFPTKGNFGSKSLEAFAGMAQRFKKVRMLGSAALMMAYVARGRVDAYGEDDIMFWDVAAGAALVRAAGGWVAMTDSKRVKWGKRVRCSAHADIWADIESPEALSP
ncbi:MAG: inositol monophosphatase family protein [Candidatus Hydrogenedentes bacterium]|nr:inositol monophosphatase [Candidatus Hydrogenedentota bacterium]MDK1021737.1 inositol monophosphatase family protein [Candidatus Hydrogenedentota bacterium]